MALVENLIQEGWLKTPRIIEAFKKVKRIDFLPEDVKNLSEINEALPIGYGQTISQPLVVAFMLELLQPESGDKILDIGAGSGWTSALLGEIVGEKGKIIAVELIPELKGFGEENVSGYSFVKKGIVSFFSADGSKGYEKEAPFDKILVSAAAVKIPEEWKKQLKIGGNIVSPVNSSICQFIKRAENKFEKKEYPGFIFVPLVSK